jgi:dephospho-CoA kinase
VAEASQLLESNTEDRYDRVLLVVAPEEERIRRWVARGGDAEGARRRVAAQIPPVEARRRATDVIVNDGTRDDLRREIDALYAAWTKPA